MEAAVKQKITELVGLIQSGALISLIDQANAAISGRSEASLALLLAEMMWSNKDGSSFFGKLLVVANGYGLASWALRPAGGPNASVWKESTGITLKGDAEAIGGLTLTLIGGSGILGALAGVAGPENHLFSIATMATTKLALAYFLVGLTGGLQEPVKAAAAAGAAAAASASPAPRPETEKILALFRHHARTGVCVVLYAVLLWWRSKAAKARGPRYIEEMEARIEKRLDALTMLGKDQLAKLDQISPSTSSSLLATSTPKKYGAAAGMTTPSTPRD